MRITKIEREATMILKRKIYNKLLVWKEKCNGTKAIFD